MFSPPWGILNSKSLSFLGSSPSIVAQHRQWLRALGKSSLLSGASTPSCPNNQAISRLIFRQLPTTTFSPCFFKYAPSPVSRLPNLQALLRASSVSRFDIATKSVWSLRPQQLLRRRCFCALRNILSAKTASPEQGHVEQYSPLNNLEHPSTLTAEQSRHHVRHRES
jgi:hypothetical protein